MARTASREIRLASRPNGIPTATNFILTRTELEPLQDQEVLVRNLFMSVDPYMRGRMNDGKSYVPPFELGKPLDGGAVGEVIESRAKEFKPDDAVIHEGLVFSNRDQRTLLDKLLLLLTELRLPEPVLLVADAYYASGKIIRGLFAEGGHLISRVRHGARAFEPAPMPSGRPRCYGSKLRLRDLFDAARRHAKRWDYQAVPGQVQAMSRFDRVAD